MTDQDDAATLAATPILPGADQRHYTLRARALYNGDVGPENGYEAHLYGMFRAAKSVTDRLRDTADRIDAQMIRVRLDLDDELPDHADSAVVVVSEVRGMLGNMHVDSIVRDAARVDRYVRTEGGRA